MAITKNLINTPKKTATVPGGPPAAQAHQHIVKATAKGGVAVPHPPSTPGGLRERHPMTQPHPAGGMHAPTSSPTEKVTVSTPQKRAPK